MRQPAGSARESHETRSRDGFPAGPVLRSEAASAPAQRPDAPAEPPRAGERGAVRADPPPPCPALAATSDAKDDASAAGPVHPSHHAEGGPTRGRAYAAPCRPGVLHEAHDPNPDPWCSTDIAAGGGRARLCRGGRCRGGRCRGARRRWVLVGTAPRSRRVRLEGRVRWLPREVGPNETELTLPVVGVVRPPVVSV